MLYAKGRVQFRFFILGYIDAWLKRGSPDIVKRITKNCRKKEKKYRRIAILAQRASLIFVDHVLKFSINVSLDTFEELEKR